MKTKIVRVLAREILDSRGFPTVETDVFLADGSRGRAAVPSGASTGSHEALELRDGGPLYMGKGVKKAVQNVGALETEIQGMDALNIRAIDEAMIAFDGTENKSRLGANALLGVSMAALRAGAESRKVPLYEHIRKVYGLKETEYIIPAPMLNIVNGGRHADSGLDVQEFMVVPTGAAKFSDALRKATEVYHNLKKILAGRKMTVSVGDEGGFAPHIRKHDEVLETIMEAVETAGYCGDEIKIAIDAAASEFYSGGKYKFEGKSVDAKKMTAIYTGWAKRFPVISLEDPLSEDDWEGWQYLTGRLGDKITIVGDDLFVTNPGRLETGIKSNAANAILIKLNQIGTVTETVDVIAAAHKAKYNCVISHRSGETEDSFIADLAVATNAGAIKTGAPCRSERLCKYNQLLRIEEELGRKAQYAQGRVFKAVK